MIDRLVGYGVAAHEGQLLGIANQLINLFVALGLMTLAESSAVLWWRRRPSGSHGAPPRLVSPPVAPGFVALLIGLGLLLPLFGASILSVLLVERLVLRHIRGAARWLGLAAA